MAKKRKRKKLKILSQSRMQGIKKIINLNLKCHKKNIPQQMKKEQEKE